MISAASAIGIVVAAIGSVMTATGQVDAWVLTETEFDTKMALHEAEPHAAASEAIGRIENWQKCDRLERRIDSLEDRKWKYQQADASAEQIRDIERDIENEKKKYDALDCAKVLTA